MGYLYHRYRSVSYGVYLGPWTNPAPILFNSHKPFRLPFSWSPSEADGRPGHCVWRLDRERAGAELGRIPARWGGGGAFPPPPHPNFGISRLPENLLFGFWTFLGVFYAKKKDQQHIGSKVVSKRSTKNMKIVMKGPCWRLSKYATVYIRRVLPMYWVRPPINLKNRHRCLVGSKRLSW